MPVLAFFTHHGSQRTGDHPVFITQEHQGHQVIVPDPEELEDGKRGQRRDGQRQDQLLEDGEVRRAINEGRFQNIPRQGANIVEQQVDRQRQPKAGVRQPHCQV